MLARTVVNTMRAICGAPSSKPKISEARTAKRGRWMQTPSMFIVAPRGREKLASSSLILRFFLATSIDTGRVAALLLVVDEVRRAFFTALKNLRGLILVNR